MYKPVADIMRDETGKPEVMQHALTFDYIPQIKPDYNQRGMADGGLLPYGAKPTDEEEEEEEDTELERLTTRIQELEDAQKPNINQPVGDGGPGDVDSSEGPGTGSEGFGPNQGAGTNTFSGTAEALGALPGQLGIVGFTPAGILGSIFSGIVSQEQQETETNVASTTEGVTKGHEPSQTGISGLFGFQDKSDEDIAADIAAAEAEAENEAAIAALDATTSVPGTPGISVSVPSGLASGPEADFGAGVGTGTGTGDVSAEASGGEYSGGAASGGLIKGYQEGAMVEEQADTTMDTTGLGPMGLVDDMDGDQVTGVEDDLDMETEEGAYVLNADAVELVGLKDLNQLVKDAIDIAIESDIPLPKVVDPTKKVPIKISNGEFVIPAILVPIIGLENLEKMNKRGLEYREKNREEAPPQEAQQQDVPVEPSEVPSRGVPGEINLAQGGALADQMNRLM